MEEGHGIRSAASLPEIGENGRASSQCDPLKACTVQGKRKSAMGQSLMRAEFPAKAPGAQIQLTGENFNVSDCQSPVGRQKMKQWKEKIG
jgi:hypothetical protein